MLNAPRASDTVTARDEPQSSSTRAALIARSSGSVTVPRTTAGCDERTASARKSVTKSVSDRQGYFVQLPVAVENPE